MDELIVSLYNRSQISSLFKSAIGGRFYLEKLPQNVTYPAVVCHFISNSNDFYFSPDNDGNHNFEDFIIQLNIYSDSSSSQEAGTILGYLKTHFDWCDLTITGYDLTKMERTGIIGPIWEPTQELWIYMVTYRILLQKQDA